MLNNYLFIDINNLLIVYISFIQYLMPTLYYTDYSSPDFTQQMLVLGFLNRKVNIEKIPPKHQPLVYVDSNMMLNQSNAISFQIAQNSNLLGNNIEDEIEIYGWLEFFNRQMYLVIGELAGQLLGKKQPNKTKFDYSFDQLQKSLKVLDDYLKINTFFVGDSMTLIDIVFCCQLQKIMRLLIDAPIRKKLAHLMRWYTYLRNTPPYIEHFGKMFLCTKGMIPHFQIPEQVKTEVKSEVKEEKGQIAEEKKVEEKDGSQFNLDNFKRNFQNSEAKGDIVKELLDNFPEGFSIWKVYYSKDVTQGKVDYSTANLARGNLARLDGLRKTGFGNLGVYYEEQTKEYEIRGVMIWKGTEMAEAWKEHPAHEYHIFIKLDPKEKLTLEVVKEYWLKQPKAEGLELYDSYLLI